MKKFKLFVMAVSCVYLFSCAKDDGNKASPAAAATEGNGTVPPPSAGTGQIVLDVDTALSDAGASGYIVGNTDLKLEKATDQTYYINDIPPGNVDIVVAGSLAVATEANLLDGEAVGLRLNKFQISSGNSAKAGSVGLLPVATLRGKVLKDGKSKHEGILVSIPGTDFGSARITDVKGEYVFENVPQGQHRILFQSDGYRTGRIEAMDVRSGIENVAPNQSLFLATGPSGAIVINSGSSYSNSLTVNLQINASDDAELMKISEDINFSGLAWEPVRTFVPWTFPSEGQKTLYIKFADANGLETSPASSSITIDQFSDNTMSFSPSFTVSDASPSITSPVFQLTAIKIPPTATAMQIYDESSKESAPWIATATSGTWTYTSDLANCGDHTLYLRFRVTDSVVSAFAEKPVSVNCWQSMLVTNGPPLGAEGYSHIFEGDKLFIFAGYTPNGMSQDPFPNGYYFDFTLGTWSSMAIADEPDSLAEGNGGYASVPGKLVVWGGSSSHSCTIDTGAVYNISANNWTPMATASAPTGRCPAVTKSYLDPADGHRKVFFWTGNENGSPAGDGGIYDINSDSWSTPNANGGQPAFTDSHKALSANIGDKIYILGRHEICPANSDSATHSYDVDDDSWAPIEDPHALLGDASCSISSLNSFVHQGNWYVFAVTNSSGTANEYVIKGASFNPGTGHWTAINMTGGITNRYAYSFAYTGDKVVFWGGLGNGRVAGELPPITPVALSDGYVYDLATGTWQTFSPPGASARYGAVASWITGQGYAVWGGRLYKDGVNSRTGYVLKGTLP